jgi:GTP cyclohydrolase I
MKSADINTTNGNLENTTEHVLNCAVQDDQGLNDFQKLPNLEEIAIPRVGIERFRIPMRFQVQDEIRTHDCEASMYIHLDGNKTGANMSRFCAILQELAFDHIVDANFFKTLLGRYRSDLRDFDTEDLISKSELILNFKYAAKQPSLKSENWGWQYYDCSLKGVQTKAGHTLMELKVNYEYSSTCPCSLSMAKQYEEDFRSGVTTEGVGVATAHSQRSNACVSVFFDASSWLEIEDLISLLRQAVPTETQSLVKRIDEQAFAILNGENPMFVEHVARRLSKALDSEQKILNWNVKIEHFESLHSHNAVAYIQKNGVK